jgi:hypothetical protein
MALSARTHAHLIPSVRFPQEMVDFPYLADLGTLRGSSPAHRVFVSGDSLHVEPSMPAFVTMLAT